MSGEEATVDQSNCDNLNDGRFTSSQQEMIKHLHEIVGGLDLAECQRVMVENKWNLEQAVHKIMDIPLPVNASQNESSMSFNSDSLINSNTLNDGSSLQAVRRRNIPKNINVETRPVNQVVIRQYQQTDFPWYWQAFYWMSGGFRRVFNLFLSFMSILGIRPQHQHQIENQENDVQHFIDMVQTIVDEDPENLVMPPFQCSSYGECLSSAKSDLKILLVYLAPRNKFQYQKGHNICASTTSAASLVGATGSTTGGYGMLKDCLCRPEFLELVAGEDALLWGCCVNSNEGKRVARALQCNSFDDTAFMGVIGLQPHSTTRMALLARLEGQFNSCEQFVYKLRTVLRQVEPGLISARQDRMTRLTTQSLRQQQDLEYQRSLQADQEREAQLQSQLQSQQQAKQEALDHQLEQQKQLQSRTEIRELIISLLEGYTAPCKSNRVPEDTISVRIRLPGVPQPICQNFHIDSSIKLIFYVIVAHDKSPIDFQVYSNLPKLLWPVQPSYDWQNYLLNHCDLDSCPTDAQDPPSFREFNQTSNTSLMVIDCDA